MAWRDTLLRLREELAEQRAARQRRVADEEAELQQRRDELSRLAASLGVAELLTEMNSILLDGRGEVETIVSWEDRGPEDEPEGPLSLFEEEEEEGDVISFILSWDEGGEMEIGVDLGLTDEGTYMQVNGADVRLEQEALQRALVQAFQEELGV